MGNIAEKVKEKITGAKDKVTDTTGKVTSEKEDDPLTEYREKEPMTPAKIKEHEPTAVNRGMTENIVEPGKEVPNPEAARERARRSGMAKGTAEAAETGSEYEQGAAGPNK
jgi:hypothetical protein